MKPRHAAVLALVGWYVMLPPIPAPDLWQTLTHQCPGDSCCPDGEQPLSEWKIQEVFDTAKQCKEALETARAKNLSGVSEVRGPCSGTTPGLHRWTYAQCVASDDPRLAK